MNPQDPNQNSYTGYQPPAPVPAAPHQPHQPSTAPQYSAAPEPAYGQPLPAQDARDPLAPTPVVQVLSPVGVEYVFLTLTLFVGAISLTSALIALVNGAAGFASLAFPAAALLVTVPLFAVIFMHLKKRELQDPRLKLDPSKRRATQTTQIISFVVCLFTVIGFLAAAFAAMGGESGMGLGKVALDALCVLAVAGGILYYYWRDEHKTRV
ncbi:MAG TPA: hypothetical protein VLF62_00645 [Candidatus Saccharimonadales bacterium]|nr:hypothetical protein [Candidatus Saccharimonadales bacterium]